MWIDLRNMKEGGRKSDKYVHFMIISSRQLIIVPRATFLGIFKFNIEFY